MAKILTLGKLGFLGLALILVYSQSSVLIADTTYPVTVCVQNISGYPFHFQAIFHKPWWGFDLKCQREKENSPEYPKGDPGMYYCNDFYLHCDCEPEIYQLGIYPQDPITNTTVTAHEFENIKNIHPNQVLNYKLYYGLPHCKTAKEFCVKALTETKSVNKQQSLKDVCS
ncbi:MAG TPA: hypothetical protein VMW10_07370 [Alphaproteobacteria bacterium]|nr:hypothetical protein [Alphaproteobacteria bacterium]